MPIHQSLSLLRVDCPACRESPSVPPNTHRPEQIARTGIPYRELLPYSATAAVLWAGAVAGLVFAVGAGATSLPSLLR